MGTPGGSGAACRLSVDVTTASLQLPCGPSIPHGLRNVTRPQHELRAMSREQWMQQYGGVLQSEQWFDKKAPAWNYDPESW